MLNFNEYIVQSIKENESVAFVGEQSLPVAEKLRVAFKGDMPKIYVIKSIDDFVEFLDNYGRVCVLSKALAHMASRFSKWVYTDGKVITAVCKGHYGDCTHRPLSQEAFYLCR